MNRWPLVALCVFAATAQAAGAKLLRSQPHDTSNVLGLRFIDDAHYAELIGCDDRVKKPQLKAAALTGAPRVVATLEQCEPVVMGQSVVAGLRARKGALELVARTFDGKELRPMAVPENLQVQRLLFATPEAVVARGFSGTQLAIMIFSADKAPRVLVAPEIRVDDGDGLQPGAAFLDGDQLWVSTSNVNRGELFHWDLSSAKPPEHVELEGGGCGRLWPDLTCGRFPSGGFVQLSRLDGRGHSQWSTTVDGSLDDKEVARRPDGSFVVPRTGGFAVVSASGAVQRIDTKPSDAYKALAVSPSGTTVIALGTDHALRQWSLGDSGEKRP